MHEPAFGNVLPLQQHGTWWKLRQPVTFEKVWARAGGSHTLLGDNGLTRDKWMIDCDNLFKRNFSAVI
jgi:hypothetical protein